MKKILVVFNGETYNSHLSSFAIRLSKQTGAILQAVFISPFVEQINTYPFPGELPMMAEGISGAREIQEEHKGLIQSNMDLFVSDCKKTSVPCNVTNDNDITVNELLDHSAFSDLILCDAKEQYGTYSFKDFITDTHCPVVLVSENARLPQRAILCYDESFSSIYAIKMYNYLFPEWKDIPTAIISINPKGDNGNKYDDYLSDWLPAHFSNIEKVQLEGNLQKELTGFIGKQDLNSIVVMGSYGGNAMSRMFHKSLSNVVLEETSASLFIVHE
jgi:hypothetical protein